jgi:C4-type Zn-finger protein
VLNSTVAEQQKKMENVIARVQEQATQSQKVTAQIQDPQTLRPKSR